MSFSASSLAQIGLASKIGGLAFSTIGAYSSAQTAQGNLRMQATAADANARIAELGAQSAMAQGQQQAAALTLKAGNLKSAQRARLAANGVDLGVGNAAEVLASTEIMKEIDRNQLEANATRTAFGYRAQAANYQGDAIMKRAAAGSISPLMAAGATLLGGAGSVAEGWYRYKTVQDQGGMTKDPIYALGVEKGFW